MEHQIRLLPSHIRSRIKVCHKSGCWNYGGKDTSAHGYQRGWYKGVRTVVHRIVYIILVGGNIEKRQLDHQCCNRSCCNPNHLKHVTHKQNCKLRDKRTKALQHKLS